MKNKLFLVALATVTVLGPSLATPHHQTVHAAERCTHVSDNPNVFLCSYVQMMENQLYRLTPFQIQLKTKKVGPWIGFGTLLRAGGNR